MQKSTQLEKVNGMKKQLSNLEEFQAVSNIVTCVYFNIAVDSHFCTVAATYISRV